MAFKTTMKYLILWSFTTVMASKINLSQENNNNLPSFYNTNQNSDNMSNDEPETKDAELYAAYGAPPPPYGLPSTSLGISVNPSGILEPHIEILKLVEAFMKLKGEVLGRIRDLITDNWDLIQGVVRLLLKKLENLHSFSLTGVSVIRRILEFAVNLFKSWTVTLPSVTFSGAYGKPPPSPVYGLPSRVHNNGYSGNWNRN